jgi:Spx/MgsR family transcriptional regulator
MATITLYGIPNCDITKKAITWLDKKKIGYSFHDYKQQGISKQKLNEWIDKAGLETIFNKRSTTWRELPEAEQKKAGDILYAIQLMTQHTSIIKRPVIESGNNLLVGFNEDQYNKQLK